MSNVLKKVISILLIILFFFLPIINSHLIDLFGIKWGFYVDGNYEFTKVMFFNIISGLIISLFFIENYLNKKEIKIPKILIPIILILFFSTIYSSHFYTSLLGNTSKSHSMIMFLNIIGLFLVLVNSSKEILKKLLITTIISTAIVGIIGIKEYFLPTFDYGNLSNRALSTLGHPNYLALLLLIIIPFITNKELIKNKTQRYIILFLIIIVLILTKSVWGIFLFLLYIIIPLSGILSPFWRKRLHFGIIILGTIIGIYIIYNFGILTKLNSFISRFYIWETTINIIFSDIKNLVIGSGLGTLDLVFDKFKSPELYIFENIGFTADRPHNLFLNFFYNFGIFGLFFLIFIIYNILNKTKNTLYRDSLILFFLFTIFNFPSIVHYLIIVLIGINIIHFKENQFIKDKITKNIIVGILIVIPIVGAIFSSNYYYSEYKIKLDSSYKTNNYLINKIEGENYNKVLFEKGLGDINIICEELINYTHSVENYFYCGNIIWNYNETGAIEYYKKGLDKLPNMWDKNSLWYNNYLINKLFTPERFYSEKFSNLKEILKRVGEK